MLVGCLRSGIGPLTARIDIAPGIVLWRRRLDEDAQRDLIREVAVRTAAAPFYRPTMPRSGKPFSVEETNFGTLGWVSDASGYRYQTEHPVTREAWPPIPDSLLALWSEVSGYPAAPECCLVNLYRAGARMGAHQDRDENALDAPVVSISLGDDAVFRIGTESRRGPWQISRLRSGDVLVFGGVARRAFHGIDRICAATSSLVPGGGRLNLTLRRVRQA